MLPIRPAMLLKKPVEIPKKYRSAVEQFLTAWWNDRLWELQNEWGFVNLAALSRTDVLRTMLAEKIAIIARYAAGEELDRMIVADSIQSVMERLFAIGTFYEIPRSFWETPFGWMALHAQLRVQGDELMTISEAAEVAGKSVKYISDLARRGKLTVYKDPSEPNPRRATRVLRSEVEGFE